LDLALEVVYFVTFDKKLDEGLMDRRIARWCRTIKINSLNGIHKSGKIPFCDEAAMLFFSNTIYKVRIEG
jgi:hypothetical protein